MNQCSHFEAQFARKLILSSHIESRFSSIFINFNGFSSLWHFLRDTKLADPTFDKGQKLAELGAITPTDLYNYIAIADRSCKQHVEDLVQLVGAQMMMRPNQG